MTSESKPAAAPERQTFAESVVRKMYAMEPSSCRMCGCTEHNACIDEFGDPCWWAAPDLCSSCAGEPL